MKNVSSLKSNKSDSPKTPGGISKSLLTPCRRLGLSRNWKKSGPSPFVSPLSGSVEVKIDKKEPKKRKVREESVGDDEEEEKIDGVITTSNERLETDINIINENIGDKVDTLTNTPTRHILKPLRKKSKTLLSSLNNSNVEGQVEKGQENNDSSSLEVNKDKLAITEIVQKQDEVIQPPKKTKSRTKKSPNVSKSDNSKDSNENFSEPQEVKTRSPNDLTKECVVVIQKKIFKTDKKAIKNKEDITSQVLFDSDTDDVPLCQLNKEKDVSEDCNKKELKENTIQNEIIEIEDDFEPKKTKVKKLEDKSTSIGGLKKKLVKSKTHTTNIVKKPNPISSTPINNSGFDDEDDFDLTSKKTILIRKTYDKVNKPLKAKSTGSITQRDIDELKARIETKKNLLLANAMTEDTEELRNLIKKWQKGCQDALMELMDLMKDKFPDKQKMDYSEMLSMLKIPTQLVGYDEDNDCFVTPDDSSIILSKFNC